MRTLSPAEFSPGADLRRLPGLGPARSSRAYRRLDGFAANSRFRASFSQPDTSRKTWMVTGCYPPANPGRPQAARWMECSRVRGHEKWIRCFSSRSAIQTAREHNSKPSQTPAGNNTGPALAETESKPGRGGAPSLRWVGAWLRRGWGPYHHFGCRSGWKPWRGLSSGPCGPRGERGHGSSRAWTGQGSRGMAC